MGGWKEGEDQRLFLSSLRPNSTTINSRFLPVNPNPSSSPCLASDDCLELEESDVVWSPLPSESDESLSSPTVPKSPVTPWSSSAMGYHRRHPQPRPFELGRSGLSAALAEESTGLVQKRKPGVDTSVSVARAVPVLLRSGSGLDASLVKSGSGRLWHMSAPVSVPMWGEKEKEKKGLGGGGRCRIDEVGVDGVLEEELEMVPPHVMVARSQCPSLRSLNFLTIPSGLPTRQAFMFQAPAVLPRGHAIAKHYKKGAGGRIWERAFLHSIGYL